MVGANTGKACYDSLLELSMDVLDKLIKQGKVHRTAGYVGRDGHVYVTEFNNKDGNLGIVDRDTKDDKRRKPSVEKAVSRKPQP